ncbi:MAG: helix-turn-helix domain-containing protein [Eubacteriales bacterium]|nr:helix-turn-helix domain-containing protein [Eubacteriales bacterium]
MGNVYDSIMAGLAEAIVDAEGQKPALRRRMVTVMPVKKYGADEVQNIRKGTGMSQKLFADYMGVSVKTVEAWEAGTNQPSGTASRILNMMEMNPNLTAEFPFVKCSKEYAGANGEPCNQNQIML